MILVERGPASSHAPAEPARAGEPAPDVLEFPSARRLGWSLKVQYRNDERSRFRRLPAGWLYVASPTGLECFPDLAAIIDNAHFTGIPAALDALEHMRPAAFVAYDEQTEELQFGRSLDGFASLYFGGELPAIVIGESNFVVARRLGPIRFSKADEEAYCKNWSPGPEGSFLEGVTRCFAGVRYRLRPNRDSVERCLMAPDADLVDQDQAVILLRDEMRRICATYGNKRVALRLSGGVDSRVVLAGLMDAVREGILRRDQVLLTSVLFPGFNCDESAEIREIVRLSGFEWVGIEATPERSMIAFDITLRQPWPPFPTAFMGILCFEVAKSQGAEVMLSGHGGDEIFDFDATDVLALPLRRRLARQDIVMAFRRANTPFQRAIATAQAFIGIFGMPSIHRTRRMYRLPWAAFSAHRVGRRLFGPSGVGYEATTDLGQTMGMLTDPPIFRAGLINALAPGIRSPRGRDRYKLTALDYIRSSARQMSGVPCRKAGLDEFLGTILHGPNQNCDVFDGHVDLFYARQGVYGAWREPRAVQAIQPEEI